MSVVARASEDDTRACPTCGSRYPADFLVWPRAGTTLRSASARPAPTQKPVPRELAISSARQTWQALAAAHARGVIHRDVKPESIFITEVDKEPFVKVLDFGISKILKSKDAKLTRTGAVLGTPAYMAPEQAKGGESDARTDVYGVGATLYTALAGRSPYEGDDPAAALTKLISNEE